MKDLGLETTQSLGNGLFYKAEGGRNSPDRFGRTYDSIEAEYRALQELKQVYDQFVPGLYAAPVQAVTDEDGEVKGYLMEEVEGFEINEFTGRFPDHMEGIDPESHGIDLGTVAEQLRYIKELKQFLPADGDLYDRNVMIEPRTSRVRFYDPAGFGPETAMSEKARESDMEELERMINELEVDENGAEASITASDTQNPRKAAA